MSTGYLGQIYYGVSCGIMQKRELELKAEMIRKEEV